jgi:hypothetical protein
VNEEDFRRNPRSALLFDAADLLERCAKHCVPGPWKVDGRAVVPTDDTWNDVARDCPSHVEADWIAMMNPTIAPYLASTLRVRGRELYLNESIGGNTSVTRDFVESEYGMLLMMAADMLGKDVPWDAVR